MIILTVVALLFSLEMVAAPKAPAYTDAEKKVLAAANDFYAAAQPINLLQLDVGYKEGSEIKHLLQWQQSFPAFVSDMLRLRYEARVATRPDLWGTFQFIYVLHQRFRHCESLEKALDAYALTEPKTREANAAREKSFRWASGVSHSCRRLDEAIQDFEFEFSASSVMRIAVFR